MAVERDFEAIFSVCLAQADLVWLIAPECDDILRLLTKQCEAAQVPVIGASSEVVDLAADKLKTAAWLSNANIDSPLSLSVSAWQAQANSMNPSDGWLAKPINGVGCEGIVFLSDKNAVNAWIKTQTPASLSGYFLQAEVQQAQAASLSMLCHHGRAYLLSANRLVTARSNQTIALTQIIVNGFAEHWASFQTLADNIAAQLPNVQAYLGVDLMLDTRTGAITVLELNPRLSSSYVGLSTATGVNIAQCLLNAHQAVNFDMSEYLRESVIVNLE